MDLPHAYLAQYPKRYQDRNKIGAKGCKYLSRAHLPNISSVELWRNEIGSPGAYHLAKAQWSSLRAIDLSASPFTQTITSSEWKACASWPGRPGTSSTQ